MKSITKKISLLLLLSATLFLSSCLDSEDKSIIGDNEVSYIAQGSMGTLYARTQRGFYITSPKIKTLTPGTIALLSYQITGKGEQETVDIDDNGNNVIADVAEISKEPLTLDKTTLRISDAGDQGVSFESLFDPLFAQNKYFGDLWIFSYTYKSKKGENTNALFYKASDEDAKKENTDVLIDVRLEKTGTPEEGAAENIVANNISVDMSSLRLIMADKADDRGNLKIKFRYYRSSNEEAVILPQNSYAKAYTMILNNN